MPWFWIWLVLVVATLVGAFLLGRHVWRAAKALLTELDRAADAVARLEELQAQAKERFPEPTPPEPALFATADERARFRRTMLAHRQAVRRRRMRRLDRARRHWRHIGTPV